MPWGEGENQSLIGREFKMADEILPSDGPISNQPVIGQEFKMADNRTRLNKMN